MTVRIENSFSELTGGVLPPPVNSASGNRSGTLMKNAQILDVREVGRSGSPVLRTISLKAPLAQLRPLHSPTAQINPARRSQSPRNRSSLSLARSVYCNSDAEHPTRPNHHPRPGELSLKSITWLCKSLAAHISSATMCPPWNKQSPRRSRAPIQRITMNG